MTALAFWVNYALLFVFGGTIILFGVVPFRPAWAAVLPLVLIPAKGLVLDRVAFAVAVFVLAVLASALVNGSSVQETVQFLRFVLTPYLMYYLVRCYITKDNIVPAMRISLAVGMIQLPVVLAQRTFYSIIMAHAANPVGPIDANFGTFFVADDPSLSFFLLGLIIFLLFDDANNGFVRQRFLKASWLSVTILLANSIMSQLMLVGILGYFLFRRFGIRMLLRVGVAGVVAAVFLMRAGYLNTWKDILVPTAQSVVQRGPVNPSAFLRGNYSRGAAIAYYLGQPVKILGDGPSRYYDPVSRTYLLGNTGQIFTLYAEAGLVGLLLSFWLLWWIGASRGKASREGRLLYFAAISGLAVTTSVLTDASIMLSYSLFMSTGLVSADVETSAPAALTSTPLAASPVPLPEPH